MSILLIVDSALNFVTQCVTENDDDDDDATK